ncbi:endonuclease/exonuclease/phosphatase family protein [Paraburkholderia kururiensis]|uniref:Endonuclease/exonuclease/phosphatase family protein n=1 Tax=Paraburkholderia kururiensis TaxID=984307 RepID=A0ABZ0WPC3_9BURK|nr:endonuclease/exonuclease/phosphatase family protein [Paraburkholderia kururiensis]WQD79238.1 endonuclease/exonuclease/phosphatase family protein [Paraburkholderia kururiensis]
MIVATWNMQGGVNTPYINQVVQQTGAHVLCLQECGNLAEHLQGRAPILNGMGAIIGYTGNLRLGYGFMQCVYWENVWAQGGLAVLSNIGINNYGILPPAPVHGFAPANPRAMPWITVRDPWNGNVISVYSIHSPPVDGLTTTLQQTCAWNNTQLAQINAIGGTWACVGDFNADPTVPGFVAPPVGNIVRGNRATQQSGGILDYAVTNAFGFAYQQQTQLAGASDHYPQVFTY